MREEEALIEQERKRLLLPEEIVSRAFGQTIQNGLPVAIWRMPQEQNIHLIASLSTSQKVKPDLEELPAGFLMSPFENKPAESIFIAADVLIHSDSEKVEFAKHISSQTQNLFLNELEHGETKGEPTAYHYPSCTSGNEAGDETYLDYVDAAVKAIKSGGFHKVVPARQKRIELQDNFDVLDTFHKLTQAYPNAFVSLVSIPEFGTWMGATPEIMIQVDENASFQTVALAGTQVRQAEKPLSETAWTQKEIEEQAMVSRYIINCFKKIRLREFEEKGPKTVIAGNLLHLKTEYAVDMQATNFPQLGTVMLDLLHPTSAVAGMPKEPALDFIKEHEPFNRKFFSGYLGPVNLEMNTNLFVNLRCMEVFQNHAILYAGAGVTEDSVPEKELAETEMKLDTLLNVIQSGK